MTDHLTPDERNNERQADNSDRNADSFERNAAANESSAESNAAANERSAIANERQAAIAEEGNERDKAESQDRMDRAARHEVRTDRVADRDERVNQFRRRMVYATPFLFMAFVILTVFLYDHQSRAKDRRIVSTLCANIYEYHRNEGDRRLLAYKYILGQYERESGNMTPAERTAEKLRIDEAYKPIPNDPRCGIKAD